MAPSPPSPLKLNLDHLGQAPGSLARAILLAMCDEPRVRARTMNYLDRLLRFDAEERSASSSNSPSNRKPGDERRVSGLVRAGSPAHDQDLTAKKRKQAGEPRICVQCDGIFLNEKNAYGDCMYHPGIIELSDELKIHEGADWDALSVEEMDTESNREKFPQAFRWICCGVAADQPGCRRSRHEANADRSLKGRGSESRDSSLEHDPLRLDDAAEADGVAAVQPLRESWCGDLAPPTRVAAQGSQKVKSPLDIVISPKQEESLDGVDREDSVEQETLYREALVSRIEGSGRRIPSREFRPARSRNREQWERRQKEQQQENRNRKGKGKEAAPATEQNGSRDRGRTR